MKIIAIKSTQTQLRHTHTRTSLVSLLSIFFSDYKHFTFRFKRMVKPKTAIKSIMRKWHRHARADAIDFHIVIAIININVGHYSYRDIHFMSKLSILCQKRQGERVSEIFITRAILIWCIMSHIYNIKASDVNDLEMFRLYHRSFFNTKSVDHVCAARMHSNQVSSHELVMYNWTI